MTSTRTADRFATLPGEKTLDANVAALDQDLPGRSHVVLVRQAVGF
jgi:hypothetical protein